MFVPGREKSLVGTLRFRGWGLFLLHLTTWTQPVLKRVAEVDLRVCGFRLLAVTGSGGRHGLRVWGVPIFSSYRFRWEFFL